MSGIHFKKLLLVPKRILTRNCLGRTTLEKLLIPAAIILLSGCILFGLLYFTNLNSGAKEPDTTTPASVLGAAKESSGKDETEPGASVKETAEAADSTLALVTDASDADVGAAGGTTKSTTKSTTKAATAAAGTNAATSATTSWSAATITPTTATAESSFSLSDISIPADLGSFSTYSTDTDTSISIPSDLGTDPSISIPSDFDTNTDNYGTIPSLAF